jgi:hypothetical protein
MNRIHLALLFSSVAAIACSSPSEPEDGSESELSRSRQGLELASSDGTLKVRVRYEIPTDRDSTLRSFNRRVYVQRGGAKVDAHCSVKGELSERRSEIAYVCRKYTSGASDTQRVDFSIVKRGDDYSLEDVKLVGDDLHDAYETIAGDGANRQGLEVVRDSSDAKLNPFAAAARVVDALTPLLGREAYSETDEQSLPITKFSWSLSEYLDATGYIHFAGDRRGGYTHFSLVSGRFDAASRFRSSDAVAKSAEEGLPKAPACVDQGRPATTAKTAIERAFTPLGGPTFGLATEIELRDVPAAVRSKMEAEGRRIEARAFEGTDYSAGVAGYYAIKPSCGSTTTIGYVVWGTGSGEPDYHDGIVIGFDTAGNIVAEEEESG